MSVSELVYLMFWMTGLLVWVGIVLFFAALIWDEVRDFARACSVMRWAWKVDHLVSGADATGWREWARHGPAAVWSYYQQFRTGWLTSVTSGKNGAVWRGYGDYSLTAATQDPPA